MAIDDAFGELRLVTSADEHAHLRRVAGGQLVGAEATGALTAAEALRLPWTAQGELLLLPHEAACLPLAFLSFTRGAEGAEGEGTSAPVAPREREVVVRVQSTTHGVSAHLLRVHVHLHPHPTHRSLHFTAPANGALRVAIAPPPRSVLVGEGVPPVPPTPSELFAASPDDFTLARAEGGAVHVRVRAGEAHAVTRTDVCVYADAYCARLLEIWSITLTSLLPYVPVGSPHALCSLRCVRVLCVCVLPSPYPPLPTAPTGAL